MRLIQRKMLFVPLIFHCSVLFTSGFTYELELKKAQKMLKGEQYDSAQVYFFRASKNGMSRDSLFYLIAETYLRKGTLDTALALNHSVDPGDNAALQKALLTQRCVIYTAAGMEQRAEALLDSIGALASLSEKRFTPSLGFAAGVGYESEKFIDAVAYPLVLPEEPLLKDTIDGLFYQFQSALTARYKLSNGIVPFISGLVSINKPNTVSPDGNEFDSVGVSGGIRTGVGNIAKRFSVNYEWTRMVDNYKNHSSINEIFASYIHSSRNSVFFSSAGYRHELGTNMSTESQGGFWIAYMSLIFPEVEVSGSMLFNGYFAPSLLWNDQDSSLTVREVRPMGPLRPDRYFISGPLDTLDASTIIPQSNIMFLAGPSVAIDMPFKFEVEISLKWSIKSFVDKCIWHWYGHETGSIGPVAVDSIFGVTFSDAVLAYGNEYYKVIENSCFGPIKRFEKKRVDNTIYCDVSVSRKFRVIGRFTLGGGIARTWSTLHDDAPIDIPDRDWSVSAKWDKTITWNKE
ncbi:MAG: hypothetical protein GF350_11535 [Chitinivibrionales bacterium]|nr:hypothetical protein [Chitinivibrionales bacterium]